MKRLDLFLTCRRWSRHAAQERRVDPDHGLWGWVCRIKSKVTAADSAHKVPCAVFFAVIAWVLQWADVKFSSGKCAPPDMLSLASCLRLTLK